MALFKTYTIATAFTSSGGVVNPDKLHAEVAAVIATFIYLGTRAGECTLHFSTDLSAPNEALADAAVAAHDGIPPAGTLRVGGGVIVTDLDDPSAPTVEAQGTTGSTTWAYRITAYSDTGETLASDVTTITDGNATLTTVNHNEVTWARISGATQYGVYRVTAGGTPSSTGLVASTPLTTYSDMGGAASGSVPSEDLSGGLIVGTGDAPAGKLVTFRELTADQSTATSLLKIARRSSGTVVAGFGSGIYVMLDDDGGTLRDVGSAHIRWNNPAAGTLHSAFRVQLRDGGSSADTVMELYHDGKLELMGDTVLEKTTCAALVAPGAATILADATWSSNNSRQAVRFEPNKDGTMRWNMAVPQNYGSGDLTLRLIYTVSATQASSRAIHYIFDWSGDAIGTTFESMHNEEDEYDTSSQIGDRPYAMDLTLSSASFSKADDFLSFRFQRIGTDAGDTCTTSFYVHAMQLRYTGWAMAGQAGQ